jgi:hypothetical protein
VVGEKLDRLVSLLRLLHAAPPVVQETGAEEPSDPDLNGLDQSDPVRLYAWARLAVWLCCLRYCAVHTSVLQRDVIPVADLSDRPRLDIAAAGERALYVSAHFHRDVAVVQDVPGQWHLRFPDWLPGAAEAVLLRYWYVDAGWKMNY